MIRPAAVLAVLALPALADPPAIEDVRATRTGPTWRFEVTLSHPDTGWENYADGWRVLAPDGAELGLRVLFHPHVEEQPFTRALTGVSVPAGLDHVLIQSRCLIDGWSDQALRVPLN